MVERPDLEAIKAKWMQILRLGNWDVAIGYVKNLASASGAPVYGVCDPFPNDARAVIAIQDPATWPEGGEPCTLQSIEKFVVHELMHVRLAPLVADNREPASINAEEQAVWAISTAFANSSLAERAALASALQTFPRVAGRVLARAAARPRMHNAPRRAAAEERIMGITAEQAQAALEALDGGNPEAAKEVLKDIIAGLIAGGAGEPPPAEGMGDMNAAPAAQDDPNKPPMGAAAPRQAAVRVTALEQEMQRAAATATRGAAIIDRAARAHIVNELRPLFEQAGIEFTKAREDKITGAKTLDEAERNAAIMRDMLPAPQAPGAKPQTPAGGMQRARSGAVPPGRPQSHAARAAALPPAQRALYGRLTAAGKTAQAQRLLDNHEAKAAQGGT